MTKFKQVDHGMWINESETIEIHRFDKGVYHLIIKNDLHVFKTLNEAKKFIITLTK